jgi:hypothetical protein
MTMLEQLPNSLLCPMNAHTIWTNSILDNLSRVDEPCVQYLHSHRTKIGIRRLPASAGAIWFVDRNIYLNSRYYNLQTAPNDPHLLSLVVHEVRHLQQGVFTALSVYGELDAWQLGFRVHQSLTGHLPIGRGENPQAAVLEIMSLPLELDRQVLRRAQILMQEYAGKGYRADLLPLYPLGKEIKYHLRERSETKNLTGDERR